MASKTGTSEETEVIETHKRPDIKESTKKWWDKVLGKEEKPIEESLGVHVAVPFAVDENPRVSEVGKDDTNRVLKEHITENHIEPFKSSGESLGIVFDSTPVEGISMEANFK